MRKIKKINKILDVLTIQICTYDTKRGGFLIFTYFTISLSGSILAHANLLLPKFSSKIIIDLPIADTAPDNGKFESVKICLSNPILIGPNRPDMSPT